MIKLHELQQALEALGIWDIINSAKSGGASTSIISGSGAVWGQVTGTLSNQTDLQSALDAKSNLGHMHDDRYYTEDEIDTLLLDKSDVGHTHVAADITDLGALYQGLDGTLTALAGLTVAANEMIYSTGADAFATTGLTEFARTLLDDTDADTARTTLGLVAGGSGDIWVEKAGDTMTGALFIDGATDTTQLTVQANATQTTTLAVFEDSAGTDIVRIQHTITQSLTSNFLNITGTLPDATSSVDLAGVHVAMTTQGTDPDNRRVAFLSRLLPGYTGAGTTIALQGLNTTAGTGNDFVPTSSNPPIGNLGVNAQATANTTGLNANFYGAANGNANVAVLIKSVFNKAGAYAVAAYGTARNVNASPGAMVGGAFGLWTVTPTFESAGLLADNHDTTHPIFLARDNQTTAFGIHDAGHIMTNQTAAATTPGSVTDRLPIYDTNNVLVGYIPVYDDIT